MSDRHTHTLSRLERVRRRATWVDASRWTASATALLVVLALVLLGLESVFYLSPTTKVVSLAALAILILAGALLGVVRPVLRPKPILEFARDVEEHFGGLHQHLTNTIQLSNLDPSAGVSSALVDAAIQQADQETRNLNLADAIDTAPASTAGKRLILVGVIALLALQLLPSQGADALSRLGRPTERFVRPQETTLIATPGDTILIEGDSLRLVAELHGIVPQHAQLWMLPASSDSWTSQDVSIRDDSAIHDITTVREGFQFRWATHDAESESYVVVARPRPVVVGVTTRYGYPTYTGMPDRVDNEGGDIATLPGTRISLEIDASRPLAEAWLTFGDDHRVEADVDGQEANASFSVDRATSFWIGLRDTNGVQNRNPVVYQILTLEDEPPRVVLLRPGNTELGERMRVGLSAEAIDDFGVAAIDIVYRVNEDDQTQSLPFPLDTPGRQEVAAQTTWDLSRDGLLPGDTVTYHLVARDNNTLTGPGIGETPDYVIRFPSSHEIDEMARQKQEETVEQLESMAERTQQIRESIENVEREILKNEEVTWQDQAELREAVQEQQAMQQELEKHLEQLDQVRDRMQQNGMLSPETLEKLEQVRSLMSALNSPELDRLSQEMQTAVDDVDEEMIREAIDRLTQEQESFQENLDRTIALLKRVQEEQMLDAVTARLRDLATDQRRIANEVRNLPEEPEPLAERQAAQTRESEHLDDALRHAADEIDTPENRLDALAKRFSDSRIPERSQQTTRDIKAGQQDRAQRGSQQLAHDLNQMADDLEAIRDAHRKAQKDQLVEHLTGVFRDALTLSRSQEQTARELEHENRRTDHEALGESQARDLNATTRLAQRIADASAQTFLVPPAAGNSLQNAMKSMHASTGHLQRRQGNRAGRDAREAMAGLNSAAMAIREAIQAVQAAGSASGLDEMLQQLSEAADRQDDLNAQTEGAMGQPSAPGGQKPGGQQPGGLSQLSAEQRAIQQMLDSLREQFASEEGDALGDLGKVSEDMEDVARRLGRNQLDRPTLERQRQILSRLLDAQTALRQKGFSNDREARAGVDVAYRGPDSLPGSLGESRNPLRAAMREALRQGYPDVYQTLIRQYFDRLIENAAQDTPSR